MQTPRESQQTVPRCIAPPLHRWAQHPENLPGYPAAGGCPQPGGFPQIPPRPPRSIPWVHGAAPSAAAAPFPRSGRGGRL